VPGRAAKPAAWVIISVLLCVVVVFALLRVLTDLPLLLSGQAAERGSFEERYVRHAAPAYLHIVPGVAYLVGACFQLSVRFRSRHLRVHRRIGRVVWSAGVLSGVFALVFGAAHSFGGSWQSVATVLFASYFLVALGLALRAVLRGDITTHRRWMIRAFAVGLAVGTIRLWVGLLAGVGDLTFRESFAPAFWLALTMHAVAAEVWLHHRPAPPVVIPLMSTTGAAR